MCMLLSAQLGKAAVLHMYLLVCRNSLLTRGTRATRLS